MSSMKFCKVPESFKCNVLMNWTMFDDKNRQKFLAVLLDSLDFTKLPLSYRRHLVENEFLIYDSIECLKKLTLSVFDSTNVQGRGFRDDGARNAIAIFDKTSKSLQRLDLAENSWSSLVDLNTEMASQPNFVAASMDNEMFVFLGDRSTYRLNLSRQTMRWERMADRTLTCNVAAVLNGCIYTWHDTAKTLSLERYDATKNKWKRIPDRRMLNRYSSLVGDTSCLYCIGGDTNPTLVEKFDPTISAWSRDDPLLQGRYNAAAVNVEDKIYLIGGTVANIDFRDPETKTWTTIADLRIARAGFSACVVDGSIFVIGGDNRNPQIIEKLDLDKKEWEDVDTLDGKSVEPRASLAIMM